MAASAAPTISPDLPPRPADPMLLPGLAGAALLGWGLRRRGVVGALAGLAGAGVVALALAPSVARLARRDEGEPAIDANLSLTVARPRREVFDFFRNFENLPLLTRALHSVDDFDDGRSRWRMLAESSGMIEWDVLVTKYVPPRVIGWESRADAAVESSGTLRFFEDDGERTRVALTLCFRPRTAEAAAAFRELRLGRSARGVRSMMSRLEAAMDRAAEPGVHDRQPLLPLPDGEPPMRAAVGPAGDDHFIRVRPA